MSRKRPNPRRANKSRDRGLPCPKTRGGNAWGLTVIALVLAAGSALLACGALSASAQAQGVFASGGKSAAAQREQRFAFRFPQQGGAALFHGICQGCHMPDAKGACGAGCYPPLAGNPAVAVPGFAVRTVVHGLHGMPAFGRMLTDRQIADVIDYIRTHFGNHYPPTITPAQVAAARRGATR